MVVQKQYRSFVTRHRFLHLRRAALVIQAAVRKHILASLHARYASRHRQRLHTHGGSLLLCKHAVGAVCWQLWTARFMPQLLICCSSVFVLLRGRFVDLVIESKPLHILQPVDCKHFVGE